MNRVGIGIDVHQFAPDRKCIIGGVHIPHDLGLLGHSDADVLTHAIADALLGAAALGDIGKFYPDTDRKWKNLDSMIILRNVAEKYRQLNAKINKAKQITDPDQSAAAWADLDKDVTSQAYFIPWLWDNNVGLESTNMKGVSSKFNSGAWDYTYSSLK